MVACFIAVSFSSQASTTPTRPLARPAPTYPRLPTKAASFTAIHDTKQPRGAHRTQLDTPRARLRHTRPSPITDERCPIERRIRNIKVIRYNVKSKTNLSWGALHPASDPIPRAHAPGRSRSARSLRYSARPASHSAPHSWARRGRHRHRHTPRHMARTRAPEWQQRETEGPIGVGVAQAFATAPGSREGHAGRAPGQAYS